MTVGAVAEHLGASVEGEKRTRVRGVSHDSRTVRAGELFVAIPGARFDGHDHIGEAVSRGAVAVICERPTDHRVPQIVVRDGRKALGRAAAAVYRHPSESLRLVGITGTNGKTTVMHMIEAVVRHAGRKTGVIGTLGARIGRRTMPSSLTTPEASDIQRQLATMRAAAVDTALMEVSSHGLALGRVDHLRFSLAVFTNLGHDHLDFHGSRENYYRSKERLFSPDLSSAAVVWTDDEWGRRLAVDCKIPVTTVGTRPEADVWGEVVSRGLSGVTVTCRAGDNSFTLHTSMGGSHNGNNAILAAGAALALGYSPTEVSEGIAAMSPVEGRFEVVADGPSAVVVDFAHTPGAIAAVISAAREAAGGRVIAVIGAGGDRDRSKRAEMARAAGVADLVVLTSDNPRTEDPLDIVADLSAGLEGGSYTMEVDRARAIRMAVGWARPGDAVLILGKGHERYQEVGTERIPFDDRRFVKEALVATQSGRWEMEG